MLVLQKYFVLREEKPLFQPLDCHFKAGDLWLLQGDNGQGKTTLLRSVQGIYQEFSGTYTWNDSIKPIFIGHANGVHPALTVLENAQIICATLGLSTSQAALLQCMDILSIGLYDQTPANRLSAGQYRKVGLIPLVHPEARGRPWLIDEPFNALDINTCHFIEQLCLAHLKRQQLILMTSHQTVLSPELMALAQYIRLVSPISPTDTSCDSNNKLTVNEHNLI